MELEGYTMIKVNYYLKVNIQIKGGMEKENNISLEN